MGVLLGFANGWGRIGERVAFFLQYATLSTRYQISQSYQRDFESQLFFFKEKKKNLLLGVYGMHGYDDVKSVM